MMIGIALTFGITEMNAQKKERKKKEQDLEYMQQKKNADEKRNRETEEKRIRPSVGGSRAHPQQPRPASLGGANDAPARVAPGCEPPRAGGERRGPERQGGARIGRRRRGIRARRDRELVGEGWKGSHDGRKIEIDGGAV